jgi:hypothetical protein
MSCCWMTVGVLIMGWVLWSRLETGRVERRSAPRLAPNVRSRQHHVCK